MSDYEPTHEELLKYERIICDAIDGSSVDKYRRFARFHLKEVAGLKEELSHCETLLEQAGVAMASQIGPISVDYGISRLISQRDNQAKEIERLREALIKIETGACYSVYKYIIAREALNPQTEEKK